MTRPEELRAIDEWLATHEGWWHEPRYADASSALVPVDVATARIAMLDTRADPLAYAKLLHRLAVMWTGRR